jgi:hypothetical protein
MREQKIKVGNKLRVIDPSGDHRAVQDSIVTVTCVLKGSCQNNDMITVVDENLDVYQMFAVRFEPVEENKHGDYLVVYVDDADIHNWKNAMRIPSLYDAEQHAIAFREQELQDGVYRVYELKAISQAERVPPKPVFHTAVIKKL